jgi:DNA polymerase sigma
MPYLAEGERLKAGLEWVAETVKVHPCFTQVKVIKTAVIPVIKLTIDTSIPFLDPSFDSYQQLNRPHPSGPLDADITVETRSHDQCSHVGLISTATINSWLTDIPSLNTVVIVLKQYFLKKQLNVTYEGGLNSFSMIVLIVAYLYHAQLQQ